jgi:hypothetical protein
MSQAGSMFLKTKITAEGRDSCAEKETENLSRLRQGPNAAGAQRLANHSPVFQDRDLLEVGAKGPASCTQRKAAIVTKGCGFSTVIALCHVRILSYHDCCSRANGSLQ